MSTIWYILVLAVIVATLGYVAYNYRRIRKMPEGILGLCFPAKPIFYLHGCQTLHFCPVGTEGDERKLLLQIGAYP